MQHIDTALQRGVAALDRGPRLRGSRLLNVEFLGRRSEVGFRLCDGRKLGAADKGAEIDHKNHKEYQGPRVVDCSTRTSTVGSA